MYVSMCCDRTSGNTKTAIHCTNSYELKKRKTSAHTKRQYFCSCLNDFEHRNYVRVHIISLSRLCHSALYHLRRSGRKIISNFHNLFSFRVVFCFVISLVICSLIEANAEKVYFSIEFICDCRIFYLEFSFQLDIRVRTRRAHTRAFTTTPILTKRSVKATEKIESIQTQRIRSPRDSETGKVKVITNLLCASNKREKAQTYFPIFCAVCWWKLMTK